MIDQDEVVRRLIFHEGMRLMPYKCPAGYVTIGVGHNLVTNPLGKAEKKVLGDWQNGISEEAALYLLNRDIQRSLDDCRHYIKFWSHLDAERKYALLDMAFNMGIKGVLKFKKMLADMDIGNFRGAAKECLNSKYAKDVGKRAERIAATIEKGEFCYD